jgi:hypothetical protein
MALTRKSIFSEHCGKTFPYYSIFNAKYYVYIIGGVKKFLRELLFATYMAFFLAKPVNIMRPIPIKRGVMTSLFLMICGKKLNIIPINMHITPQNKRHI